MPSSNGTIRIAIISDLHCHGLTEFMPRESLLIAGEVRVPANRHPAAALLELIDREPLEADILLCPGDLANKVSQAGMLEAFRELRDAGLALGASLVSTLGNHDVASRSDEGDPFSLAKAFHTDFPIADNGEKNRFWAEGFFVHRVSGVETIAINSSYHHYSEPEARCGTFPESAIQRLDNHLATIPPPRLRIALLHHHPVLHSTGDVPSSDVLPTGDQLLEVLAGHGVRFIVHGHRHHPRLTRHLAAGVEVLVMAAGSFSFLLRELGTQTRNVFHYLELAPDTSTGPRGILRTWEFRYSEGWVPSTMASAKLPHIVRFGPRPAEELPQALVTWLHTASGFVTTYDQITEEFPDVKLLLPDELRRLYRVLEEVPELKILKDEFGCLRGVGHLRDVR